MLPGSWPAALLGHRDEPHGLLVREVTHTTRASPSDAVRSCRDDATDAGAGGARGVGRGSPRAPSASRQVDAVAQLRVEHVEGAPADFWSWHSSGGDALEEARWRRRPCSGRRSRGNRTPPCAPHSQSRRSSLCPPRQGREAEGARAVDKVRSVTRRPPAWRPVCRRARMRPTVSMWVMGKYAACARRHLRKYTYAARTRNLRCSPKDQ